MEENNLKVLDTIWFSQVYNHFAVVVCEDKITKKRKAYIGVISGSDQDSDTLMVLRNGAPIPIEHIQRILKILTSNEAKKP